MNTLTADKSKVVAAYGKATVKEKALLSSLFGKEQFEAKITDRVKTFEDACKVLKLSSKAFPANLPKDVAAYYKLTIIAKALNEGWQPDWKNDDEKKFYAWFDMNPTGFCLDDVRYGYTGSGVGSRLCFRTSELAKYAAEQFKLLYKDYMLG